MATFIVNHKTLGQFEIIVDSDDLEKILQYKWHMNIRRTYKYPVMCIKIDGKFKKIKLHRFIMGVEDPNILIDHIDGNTLNNKKTNLRTCNSTENSRNQRISKTNTSGYKGVVFRKDQKRQYRAQIYLHGKYLYLGSHYTIEEAALAYNTAALQYFGEFAYLNEIKKSS